MPPACILPQIHATARFIHSIPPAAFGDDRAQRCRVLGGRCLVVGLPFPLLVAALLLGPPTAADQDALPSAERARLVEYLDTTAGQVLAQVDGLSDAQWSFKPSPNGWSIGDVVEHLALAEEFLFDIQQKLMSRPPAPAGQRPSPAGRDQAVLKAIADGTQRVTAPESLLPVGRMGGRAEVIAAFNERRARTLEYARATKEDLRSRVEESPLGPMDGYRWLLFIAAHTARHLQQIRELKAQERFPGA
jgi:hypothetical protein